MTMKTQQLKTLGCSKSSSKREFYRSTILPEETRKTSNRQPNFTSKTPEKRRTKKFPKLAEERNHKDQRGNKQKEK